MNVDGTQVLLAVAGGVAVLVSWFMWGTRSKTKPINVDARIGTVKSDAHAGTVKSDAHAGTTKSNAHGDRPIKIDADL